MHLRGCLPAAQQRKQGEGPAGKGGEVGREGDRKGAGCRSVAMEDMHIMLHVSLLKSDRGLSEGGMQRWTNKCYRMQGILQI